MAPSELAKQMITAARTDPAAAHRLAGLYRGGEEGLLQSSGLAFRWELRAAERGHVIAQRFVGEAYRTGVGVEVNYAAATAWLEKAAEQGDCVAQYNLGVAFQHGKGTPQNYELAANWFQRAADQGETTAMVNLGVHFDTGHGVEQDHARANALYREAIEADGNPKALFNLGSSFFNGTGVEQNVETAHSFWQRAADVGNAWAQSRIGWAYMKGQGGYSKNIQLARRYIKVSAAQGDDKAVALLKEWNACAHCGTASAPKICSGCITTRYCR
jgi:hypothetical protein